MDKLKNLLKSDTPAGTESTESGSGTAGRLGGQGSHFPGKDETTTGGIGSTVTGTDPQSRGPADVSATPASSTAAATTVGPEQGGSGHVGTTSGITGGPKDYSIASADFPKTQTSTDGSGNAAIGQTSTYTTSHLSKGDPTSSIVDPKSSDPLTYKKPEAGVESGAAATAASLAFAQGEERKMTDMPGHENPYRATTLDPRVDGLSKDSAPLDTSTSAIGHGSSLGTTATSGAGAGLAGAGATSAYTSSGSKNETVVPSSLTTTADPTSRSSEYQTSTGDKGLGSTTATDTTADSNRQSVVGRVLGAVGLGSVAGAFGAGTVASADSNAATESQPTTTTGVETYNAPTKEGPPTTHHRKESIPTTAYPSATFDSPRAINPPVGGAGSPVVHGDQSSNTGRSIATGVAAGGVTAGAAAVGAHEYEQSRALRDNVTSGQPGTTSTTTGPTGTTGTSGLDTLASDDAGKPSTGLSTAHHATTIGDASTTQTTSSGLASTGTTAGVTGLTTGTGPSDSGAAARATEHPTTTTTAAEAGKEKDNTARDIALGAGAGAAVAGTGAYAGHEYSKKEAEKAEKETAKEESHHQKELEKEEKKRQKEVEKEEKKHQKELEKEEKKHHKEAEHDAEVAALKARREQEKEHARLQKQQEEEAEDRKNREEKERLAAVAGVGGAAGATAAHEEKEKEKEKKPNIFKRIFKRRKNKDTGEEEEYSSDEDPSKSTSDRRKSLQSGTSAKTQEERYDSIPSGQKELVGAYGARLSGHPEDHPYHDNTERRRSSVTKERRRSSLVESQIGPDGKTQEERYDSIPSDQKERVGAYGARLAGHPEDHPYHDNSERRVSSTKERRRSSAAGTAGAVGTGTAVVGTTAYEQASGGAQKPSYNPFSKDTPAGVTSSTSQTDAITGLPYDPSKDPEAARRLSSLTHGEGIGTFDKKDAALATGTGAAGATALGSGSDTATGGAHSGSTAPATLESTGTRSMQPTEAVTGTPATTTGTHDKSTAPATLDSTGTHTMQPAAAVTGTPTPHDKSTVPGTTTEAGTSTLGSTGTAGVATDFTLGEISDTRR